MRVRAGGCTADGEAREDKEGEVGNAEGTSRAEWSSGKGGWESKGGAGATAEGPPRFVPVCDVAVLKQPRANARAKDGKAVIELSRMAESVSTSRVEEVKEAAVYRGGIKQEGRVRLSRRGGSGGAVGEGLCTSKAKGDSGQSRRTTAWGVGASAIKEGNGERGSNIGTDLRGDWHRAANSTAGDIEARTTGKKSVGSAGQPVCVCTSVLGVQSKEATQDGINNKARVGTVGGNVGRELTRVCVVHVPADVAEGVGRARLAAALIAKWASIHDGHVEGVCRYGAKPRVGVACIADGSAELVCRGGGMVK